MRVGTVVGAHNAVLGCAWALLWVHTTRCWDARGHCCGCTQRGAGMRVGTAVGARNAVLGCAWSLLWVYTTRCWDARGHYCGCTQRGAGMRVSTVGNYDLIFFCALKLSML
jgi:hypothetical protein